VRGSLGRLSFEDRQQLIRTVVERVMVEEGQIDIHFAIPLPDPSEEQQPEGEEPVSALSRLRSHHLHVEFVMGPALNWARDHTGWHRKLMPHQPGCWQARGGPGNTRPQTGVRAAAIVVRPPTRKEYAGDGPRRTE
jgi:hypothetical protein